MISSYIQYDCEPVLKDSYMYCITEDEQWVGDHHNQKSQSCPQALQRGVERVYETKDFPSVSVEQLCDISLALNMLF